MFSIKNILLKLSVFSIFLIFLLQIKYFLSLQNVSWKFVSLITIKATQLDEYAFWGMGWDKEHNAFLTVIVSLTT